LYLKIILPFLAALCGSAQTTCPPINFLNAKTVNLNPTNTSHLVVLRQSDGSSTAFEIANTSPYRVLTTIPHFEKQFSNCLPRAMPAAPGKVSSPAPNAPGIAAQPVAFAVLDSGNYLFVLPVANSLDIVVFDHNLQLVSETQIGALTGPGYLQGYLSPILADMNGDGKLDVVAEYELELGGGEGSGVQVFYGDGSGGFQPAGGFSLDGFLYGSMAVADLNGDGKPDVIVGTGAQPGKQSSSGAGLVIALNKGDGTFVTSTLPTPDEGPAAIAIADLNGDGKNDLVYLTSPVTTNVPALNEVVVALGRGDGTFSPRTVIPVNIASTPAPFGNIGTSGAIAIWDMNGDGIPDIVTNGISILLGDGKGGFPTRKDFLNTAGESVILTDFDGDGKLDVVIGTGNPLVLNALGFIEGTLTVFLGDGAGGLAAAPIAPSPIPITENASPFYFPYGTVQDAALASGDFNHDGIADLALVTAFQYLTVFLGNASGMLVPMFSYDFSAVDQAASPTSVAVGDFNGDGILDLAVTVARSTIARPVAPASILVFLGKGDGTFLTPVSSNSPVVSIWSLVTGDFNKDGKADVAAINSSGSLAPDQVVVFLGQGDGTFAPAQTYPAGVQAAALAVGDFNQDGAADISIANQAGVSLLFGNADGTMAPGISIPFSGVSPVVLVAADLNGDGKLDLVAGDAVLLGHGDGTFAAPLVLPNGTGPSLTVGDINGDGIPDIISSDGIVLIGLGDGTFTYQLTNLGDGIFTSQLDNDFAEYGPLVAADFNGDGKLDVAIGFFTTSGGTPPLENGAAIFFNLSQHSALLSAVSAADFSEGPLSPHSIVSAFGKHVALSTASGTTPLLPTTLAGTSVNVQDQTGAVSQAEIYYASPQQVNFVLPAGLEPGAALITIKTTDGQSASTEIQIASNPKLFLVDPSGIPAGYVVRVGSDNVQTVEPIFTRQGGQVQEVPIDVSTGTVYLILFGTGFDAPVDTTASSLRSPCPADTPTPCSNDLSVTFAGPQAQFPGLDQVNVLLPSSLAGTGVSNLSFSFETSQQNLYITIK
jgi:uncharacterized protein (TIGR03437 family)